MILPSLSIVPYAHNRAGSMFTQLPLDGGLTVSSSDQGTIVNADGLIERSPKNLCINTQNFTAASWAQTSSPTVVDNAEIAPDGTMTAASMTNGQIQYAVGIAVVGKQYTCSMYIRRISGTGAVRFRAVENINTDISVTSEWQRFSLTVAATTTTLRIGINLESGTSTVAIWGAQIEESLTPTSYQRVDASRLNFPRIDWLGQSCPALLVEPSAQNVILRSEQFDNASWSKNATGINTSIGTNGIEADVAISPDGTQNADRVNFLLQADLDLGLSQNYAAAVSGQTYNTSIWFRGEGSNIGKQIKVRIKRTSGGTATESNATITLTSGWVRFASSSITLGASNIGVLVIISSNDATSALIWGAQLETGAVATTYIPTTTGAVTRNADQITASGALVSGLIGQSEGTIYWDIAAVASVITGTGNPQFGVRNTAFTNWISLTSNGLTNPFRITAQATTGNLNLINYQANITSGKAALAWSSAGLVLYVNGTSVATSATNPNFSFDRIDIIGLMVFKANAFALYTTRLDNYDLMAMTSLDTSYEQLAARLSYAT
jgi:hypothetical protein